MILSENRFPLFRIMLSDDRAIAENRPLTRVSAGVILGAPREPLCRRRSLQFIGLRPVSFRNSSIRG
jgi:hypothetical protein